jgi:hypothetical protein
MERVAVGTEQPMMAIDNVEGLLNAGRRGRNPSLGFLG